MAPRNFNCFLGFLKCDPGELDEAMFQSIERPCILGIQKSDFNEIAGVMF
jgi:hypothetical protein